MTITDKIVPNLVGIDVGCGMEVIKIVERDIDSEGPNRFIYTKTPSGFDVRKSPHNYTKEADLENLYCYDRIQIEKAMLSIGTLGGGNHFIEVDRDDEENLYIVIHLGSWRLGVEVAMYYQNKGFLSLHSATLDEQRQLIAQLKAEG